MLKFSSSDIKLGDTYVDRIVDQNNGTEVRRFDKTDDDITAWTFAFQEAVQKLSKEEQEKYDVRILVMWFADLCRLTFEDSSS